MPWRSDSRRGASLDSQNTLSVNMRPRTHIPCLKLSRCLRWSGWVSQWHYSFSPLNFILSNPYNMLGMCWGILYTSSVPYHHPYNINVILRYIKLMEACLCQILMLNCWVSPGVGVFRAAQVSMVGQTSGPEEFEPNLNGEFMGSSAPIAANLHHKSWRSSGDWWNYFWIVLGVLVYQTYDCVQKTRNKCLLSSQEVGLFHINVGNLQATWQSLQLYLACAELTFFL